MDVEEALAGLYALPPERFVARREEIVAAARARGLRALALQVGELRRPSLSAWALNLLAREHADVLGHLVALGAQLRAKEAVGLTPRPGALTREREAVLEAMTALAARTATEHGRPIGEGTRHDVRASLRAALESADAAAALVSGVLTHAPQPATTARRSARPAAAHRPAAPASGPVPGTARGEQVAHRLAALERTRADERERRDRERAQARVRAADTALSRARLRQDLMSAREAELVEQLAAVRAELEAARQAATAAARALQDARREAPDGPPAS